MYLDHLAAHILLLMSVCDETSAERCPIFPGVTNRLHWSFPDPAALKGTREERLAGTREIRDQIRDRIEEILGIIEGAVCQWSHWVG